jgi:uncharacterized DUF497 family protein
MNELSFEWDPKKAESNEAKHGVSFDEAKTVFYDERALVIPDPDHSRLEDRFVIMGMSSLRRALVVVHCLRGDNCERRRRGGPNSAIWIGTTCAD